MNTEKSRQLAKAGLLLLLAMTQSACVAVGYRAGGGWFIWPGGLGLLAIILLLYFLFGRGR
ncbi:MAG: hypothetical protein ACJ74Y_04205 [Bryobacteraceae bacterium]